MTIIFGVILICWLNGINSDSSIAYRHYYTGSEEEFSSKEHLLQQYLYSILHSHLKHLNTNLSIVTPSDKGVPYIDTNSEHPNIPGFNANPVWDTIELSNNTENLPLEAYINTHSNIQLNGTTEQTQIDEEFPLSDESFPAGTLNYNIHNISKCPEGLIFHQTVDGKISCYKITDPTTFPPPCPYPLIVDYFLYKNVYKAQLTNKIVWAFAKRNEFNGAYEWINYIHNQNIISTPAENPYTRSIKKDCMIINGTELIAVNCQEKYSGICIYNFEYSIENNYCKKKFKTTCFGSSLGVVNKCNCIETLDALHPSRSSFCSKLAETRDPYQNTVLTHYLRDNQVCWFGLQKYNWMSDNALTKYSFWSGNTDFSKNYGAITQEGWLLEDNGNLHCAICENNINVYANVRLHLKRNFTSNKLQLEIYNPTETFKGVVCSTGSHNQFIEIKTTEEYILVDLWSYDQLTEDSWCKTLQMPNLNLIYSNRIMGNKRKSNIFAVTWSFSVTSWDNYDKSCPIINNEIIKLTQLVKVLELQEENKVKVLCHLHIIPRGLSIFQDYNILKNLVGFQNMTLESISSVQVCLPSETTSNSGLLHWPQANIGSTVISKELCLQDSDSPVTRTCGGDHESGAQWLPVNGSCSEVPAPSTTVFLNELLHSSPTLNTDISKDLLVFTENKTNLDTFQIHLISQILENIATYNNISIKDVVSTVNNIMQFEPRNLRGSQVLLNSTDIILWSLDEVLLRIDTETNSIGYISEGSEKLLIQATNLIKTDIKGFRLHSSNTPNFDVSKLEPLHQYPTEYEIDKNLDLTLVIPQSLRNDIVQCTGSKGAPSIITSMFYNDVLFNENDNATGKCDGKILSVLIPGFNCSFSTPIQIIFKSNSEVNSNLRCASWSYGANEYLESIHGHWSLETIPKSVGNSTNYKLCEFSHTTHFSLLVLDENKNISEGHKKALDIITAVGSGLSILGLLAIFLTALLFKSYRTSNGVVINFSFAVTAQIVFLFVAGSVSDDPTLCTVFGALLHYTVLSEFFWMLTIAILQYQRYVIIFSSPPTHLVAKSCLFAWGVPLIPIIIILSVSTDNYGPNPNGFCYALGNYFTFAVIVPVAVIILINLIIFLRIMISLVTSRRIKVHQDKAKASVLQLRLAFMLFFLLGLTWGFGLFANLGGGLAYSYLFCLTATLQGFVLFLFFIVLNEKTRMLWVNMKTCWRKSDEYDVTRDSASSVMMRKTKSTTTDTCTDSATSDILRKLKSRTTSEF